MNKYIYKVRFVTLYNKKICINMNYNFGKQQQFQQQKKLIANKSMNALCLFSQKFHFLTSDR